MYFIVIFLFYSIVCFYWRVFIFTVVVESVISVIVEYRHLLPAGSESNHPSMSFPVEQSRAECATAAAAAAAAWVLSDSAWASNTGERPRHFSSLAYWKLGGFERGKNFLFLGFLLCWEKNRLIFLLYYVLCQVCLALREFEDEDKSFHVFNAGVRWRDKLTNEELREPAFM